MARRFVCAPDRAWRVVSRGLCAAGVGAAALTAVLQVEDAFPDWDLWLMQQVGEGGGAMLDANAAGLMALAAMVAAVLVAGTAALIATLAAAITKVMTKATTAMTATLTAAFTAFTTARSVIISAAPTGTIKATLASTFRAAHPIFAAQQRRAGRPPPRNAHPPGTTVLRWDTQHWWLHSLGAPLANLSAADRPPQPHSHVQGPGSVRGHLPAQVQPEVQVHVQVLVDLEHWMLLRLVPVGSGWRFWRHRCLAVSRRQQGDHWSLLRIHLFMART